MPSTNFDSQFSPSSRWIWGGEDRSTSNVWRHFRRRIDIPADLKQATRLVTADSRYELSINAEYIGRGPVRSFPWAYSYDVYDVTPYLTNRRTGVIAALVNYLGDHTMGYIRGAPGFLCELRMARLSLSPLIGRGRPHRASRSPRKLRAFRYNSNSRNNTTHGKRSPVGPASILTTRAGSRRRKLAPSAASRGRYSVHAPFRFSPKIRSARLRSRRLNWLASVLATSGASICENTQA